MNGSIGSTTGGGSISGTSDHSFELIDERETCPSGRWVPDHDIDKCHECRIEFRLLRRKHHCRNCGNIFCDSCSNQQSKLPNFQLHTPQRVCQNCYDTLNPLGSSPVTQTTKVK